MGLFGDLFNSVVGEKTVKCANCGREFQVSSLSGKQLCQDCEYEQLKIESAADSKRAMENGCKNYSTYLPEALRAPFNDMQALAQNRTRIIEKYRGSDMVTEEEIIKGCENAGVVDIEESKKFLRKFLRCTLTAHLGCSIYNQQFAISHLFDGIVIDFEDVFCATIVPCSSVVPGIIDIGGTYISMLMTNDPFAPAIGFVIGDFIEKESLNLFSAGKTKANNKEMVIDYLSGLCPNLQYPIMEAKDLKNFVQKENSVRGSIDLKSFLELIETAKAGTLPFFPSYISKEFSVAPFGIEFELYPYGYRTSDYVYDMLFEDKDCRPYWQLCYSQIQAEDEAFAKMFLNGLENFVNNGMK